MKTTTQSDDVKMFAPLLLIFWMPMTALVVLSVHADIRWQFFHDTSFTTKFYTDRFSNPSQMYLWLIGEIGAFGCVFMAVLAVAYIWMTRQLIIAIFKR